MADKYIVPVLKIHAAKKSAALVHTSWRDEDFPSVIVEVWSNTLRNDRGFRDPTLSRPHNFANLAKLKSFGGFKAVLRKNMNLASDLVLFQLSHLPKLSRQAHSCPTCKT